MTTDDSHIRVLPDTESIGGAVEEIHLALGTEHHERLAMGFLADNQLPLGPIDCE